MFTGRRQLQLLLALAGRPLRSEPAHHRAACVFFLPPVQVYQRQGIAHRLLGFALNYAAETACRAVYLHVAAFNQAARAFYARAGFRELALLPNFYTIRWGGQKRGTQAWLTEQCRHASL